MARQGPKHRGTPESQDREHSRNAQTFTTPVRWTYVLHARWTLTKEAVLQRSETRQAIPRRPTKALQTTLKATLKSCDIDLSLWEESAQNRSAWRSLFRSGVDIFVKGVWRSSSAVHGISSTMSPGVEIELLVSNERRIIPEYLPANRFDLAWLVAVLWPFYLTHPHGHVLEKMGSENWTWKWSFYFLIRISPDQSYVK